MTIVVLEGTVSVRLPGSTEFVDVSLLREIPLGSTIDARSGRVRVTVEVDDGSHRTQSSLFYGGIFKVLQTTGRRPVLVLKLVGGSSAGCEPERERIGVEPGTRAASSRPAVTHQRRSKRKVRRLWGRGEGDFRTTGRRSSATVRGTWWLVEDRCDGTLTYVRQGIVDVRDVRLQKTIRLQAGKRDLYLAKAP